MAASKVWIAGLVSMLVVESHYCLGQESATTLGEASLQWVVKAPENVIQTIAFSPNGKQLGFLTEASTYVADVSTGKVLFRSGVKPLTSWGGVLAFSPNALRLVASNQDKGVDVWDLKTRSVVFHIPPENSTYPSEGMAFSRDGSRLLETYGSASAKQIKIWDATSAQLINNYVFPQSKENFDLFIRDFSPDGTKVLVINHTESLIEIWTLADRKRRTAFKGHPSRPWQARFLADGRRAISADEDGNLIIWDISTGHEINRLKAPNDNHLTNISLSGSGNLALIAGQANATYCNLGSLLVDIETWKVVPSLPENNGFASLVSTPYALSQDGKYIAVAGRFSNTRPAAAEIARLKVRDFSDVLTLWKVPSASGGNGSLVALPKKPNAFSATADIEAAFARSKKELAAIENNRFRGVELVGLKAMVERIDVELSKNAPESAELNSLVTKLSQETSVLYTNIVRTGPRELFFVNHTDKSGWLMLNYVVAENGKMYPHSGVWRFKPNDQFRLSYKNSPVTTARSAGFRVITEVGAINSDTNGAEVNNRGQLLVVMDEKSLTESSSPIDQGSKRKKKKPIAPKRLFERDAPFLDVIMIAQSMNDAERADWFLKLPVLSSKDKETLFTILSTERKNLADLDTKAGWSPSPEPYVIVSDDVFEEEFLKPYYMPYLEQLMREYPDIYLEIKRGSLTDDQKRWAYVEVMKKPDLRRSLSARLQSKSSSGVGQDFPNWAKVLVAGTVAVLLANEMFDSDDKAPTTTQGSKKGWVSNMMDKMEYRLTSCSGCGGDGLIFGFPESYKCRRCGGSGLHEELVPRN